MSSSGDPLATPATSSRDAVPSRPAGVYIEYRHAREHVFKEVVAPHRKLTPAEVQERTDAERDLREGRFRISEGATVRKRFRF